ncbi:hypothetical protein [Streptomyces sp. NPDC059928]
MTTVPGSDANPATWQRRFRYAVPLLGSGLQALYYAIRVLHELAA